MAKKVETVPLRLPLSTLLTDPTQYKVYSPMFAPVGVSVIVQVPSEYVLKVNKAGEVEDMTPDGMAFAAKAIAKTIRRWYDNAPTRRDE